jgi:GTP-binding nuclear protein Ran
MSGDRHQPGLLLFNSNEPAFPPYSGCSHFRLSNADDREHGDEKGDKKGPDVPKQVPDFKLILCGDGGTGKTALWKRVLTGEFERKYVATFGVEVHPLVFHTNRGPVRFSVWDTAGQEKLGGLRDGYYVDSDAALIAFSDKESLAHVANWRRDFMHVAGDVPVVAVGTKFDLAALGPADDLDSETQQDMPFFPTSSKAEGPPTAEYWSGEGLESPFLWLARELLRDPSLEFVRQPALRPPTHQPSMVQDQQQKEFERQLAGAAAFPIPGEEEDI